MERLSKAQLADIERTTLGHYDGSAGAFWEGTRSHDVRQNIDALLDALGGRGPHTILDLGCGPGRDLVAFAELGHRCVGLDGSPTFVRMARQLSGCEVLCQSFLALDLPAGAFDGVFANASLFHVPRQELPRVLGELRDALRPGGVLFSSNPRGENQEGWSGERFGAFHDYPSWRGFLTDAGFAEIRHYYRPPGLPPERQPWLASLWRR
jgi:SAM-dependent methyltransferase